MTEDSSEVTRLASELKSLVGYGITPEKVKDRLQLLRSVLDVPDDARPTEAARMLRQRLRTHLHRLPGSNAIFARQPLPISSQALLAACECLFHLIEPAELKDRRYVVLQYHYERRRRYAMDKLGVDLPMRRWRDVEEHELMAFLARVLLSEVTETPQGRIDREEANYFLDRHGCIVRSEHVLAVTPLVEGWKRVGHLILPWRRPFPLVTPDGRIRKEKKGLEGHFTIGGTSISYPIGSNGELGIGIIWENKVYVEMGLPDVAPGRTHTLAWKVSYECNGQEAAGRPERAEVVYATPVAESVLRMWPGAAALWVVSSYERLIPAGREHGLGLYAKGVGYPHADADGSYSVEFHNLIPLRYYGLEWTLSEAFD